MSEEPPKRGLMPLSEKVAILRKVAIYPAITVMVFTRHHVGFRMIKPTWLLLLGIGMITLPLIFRELSGPVYLAPVLYALAVFGWGHWQRWRRWCDICAGVRWHSYSPGICYLQYLPWPAFMQSHRRVTRFVEPIALAVIAGLVAIASHLLGLWLLFAAVFLMIYENDLYDAMLNGHLDVLDGLLAAEVNEESVKHFQQAQPADKARALEETAGIPTGVAPDIEALVARRQEEYAAAHPAPGPDNLAQEEPAPAAPLQPVTQTVQPPAQETPPQKPQAPDNLATE